MKKLLAGLMALGGLGFAGCATESGDYVATEAFELNMACYNTQNGLAPMKAALAVAMATEIGRLTPDVDLKKIQVQAQYHMQDALGLTDAAKNQCALRGKTGCPNTQALLELQNPIINSSGLVKTSTLDATNFATDMIASLGRQAAHLQDLRNQPWRLPANDNAFTMLSVNDWGACGEHVDFQVSGTNPQNQIERLVFFGNGSTDASKSFGNPFLAPILNQGRLAIDPDPQLTGTGTASSSGTVTNACIVYSSTLLGAQCTCEGKAGTYTRLRAGTFTCK